MSTGKTAAGLRIAAVRVVAAMVLAGSAAGPLWAQQSIPAHAGAAGSQPGAAAEQGQIRVTGQGHASAWADRIVIDFGVETMQDSIEQVKSQNAAIVVAAIDAIKKAGISADDINIDQLNIEPRYRDPARRQGVVSYTARNAFTVIVNSPAKVEQVVSVALTAGVNYINAIEYGSTRQVALQEQAREQALEAARAKAVKMAAVLGLHVGRALDITEGPEHWQTASGYNWSRVPAVGSGVGFNNVTASAQVTVVFGLQP